ncbi:MAG: hypothetical protein LBI87_10680 [Candidatus Accumulibacter sp.]|jgi:hypothetical protein|nr:hypothetical protein [Accumulibacter sp.]
MKTNKAFLTAVTALMIGTMGIATVAAQTKTIGFVSIDASGWYNDEEKTGDRTSRIYIGFDQRVPLLSGEVKITPANTCEFQVVQNPSGNGRDWEAVIINVTKSQLVTVTIQKKGYIFNPPSQQVEIYDGKNPIK